MARCIILLTLAFFVPSSWSSRVKIERNGYKDILVALPRNVEQEDRARVIRNVESIFTQSSKFLLLATKGRAFFSEVTLLAPYDWDIPDDDESWSYTSFNSSDLPEGGATWTVDDADIVVTPRGEYPHVLHQAGCGRRGLRIYIPKDVLSGTRNSKEFVRLWSEYRYGVFPEGGFQNDERFPVKYTIPGEEEEKVTQCSNTTKWLPNVCGEGFIQCSEEVMTSSLMDQHLPPSTRLFCEGEVSLGAKHNPEPPSKHNLLCREEGTWFTVMRSPDFFRGKNAPPKRPQNPSVSFHYVRETIYPRVIVAVEISSRMQQQSRYLLTKAAFSRFVANILPDGSKLTLFVFGGDEDPAMLTNDTLLSSDEAKTRFLENQLLPEDTQDSANVSLDLLMDNIFQAIDSTGNDRKGSPDIIVVTTVSHIPETQFSELKQRLLRTGSRLNILLFGENDAEEADWASLYDLCYETHGQLIWLDSDPFGNLYSGFGNSLHGLMKEILIMQDYLAEDDDVDLTVPFVADESLTEYLKVELSFPYSRRNQLLFSRTSLRTPSGELLTFRKQELLSSWVADIINPEVGEYVITTRRVIDATNPILVTVSSGTSLSDDSLAVKLWTETLTNSQIIPPPVQIFVEIKKGWNPVKGAKVTAIVHHPNNVESELLLLDNGLGNGDITKDDGIYGRYFTNFTSKGYYNVRVKVSPWSSNAEYLKEPDDFCCGSAISAFSYPTGNFQREAGPETFYVATQLEDQEDHYPPSRVTDLKLNGTFDRICIVQWTAVGDDYDSGFATNYELKAFPDRALIHARFSDSGLQIHREIIQTTSDATQGVLLNHIFEFPETVQEGTYYLGIRAMDESGNAGEPSNAIPVRIEGTAGKDIDCNSEESPENLASTFAEKLQDGGNSAKDLIPSFMIYMCVLVNSVLLTIT